MRPTLWMRPLPLSIAKACVHWGSWRWQEGQCIPTNRVSNMWPLTVSLALHLCISFLWVRACHYQEPSYQQQKSLQLPIFSKQKPQSTTNAYLPTYEILWGFKSQEQYIAQYGLLWSFIFPEVYSKIPIDSSRARTSYQFPRGQLCWELCCMHCKERVSPTLQLALTLVMVFACGGFIFACFTDQAATIAFWFSCKNKTHIISIFQPKMLQGWKLDKTS